jgi:D-alanyl-D-alanine carboxypeptidase
MSTLASASSGARARARKASHLLAVAGLAVALAAVPAAGYAATVPAVGHAATGPAVPPLDVQALTQSIAGLPGSQDTAAVVSVGGSSGRWAGASGQASLTASAPAGPGDEVRVGSVSKTFIATVVLQLVAEHRIRLDEPVQRCLPGLLRAGDPPVTVAELLNHTSGLGPADGSVNGGDPQWFLANRLGSYTAAQLLGPVLQQPLIFAPGTRQQYNGVNYIVLAMLIQRVTGHGYAQEIEQRILRPLGLRHTYVPAADPALPAPYLHAYDRQGLAPGAPPTDISQQSPTLYGAQGAMISTPADLERFITALFRGRLLPPAQLADMFAVPAVASGPFRYGMGLVSYTFPDGVTVWGHTGETPGYATVMLATRDLARTLIVAFTPVEPADGNQVLATELAIGQAAYDPPAG